MPSGDPALPPETARWSVDELIPFGKYILLNKISSGATAAVYRAKIRGEAGFERLLTIKRILPQMAGDPDFVETFVAEAKICARLNHSSICPIYELGKVGESLYMAMEWVAGKDLGAIVRRLQYTGKVMPPLIAAWIISRVCDALDYAHLLKDVSGKPIGIVHQDLSPANIVISYEGQVKLIDFGLAKAAGRAQQTNVDALKQKIGYMSPELVRGVPLDARSDVFGVGVCLYEMVTGRRLFAGPDDIATLKLVSSAVVPPPSALVEDTPEELELIMMRALERDPDRRWATAGEMGQALTACIAADDPTFGTRHVAEFMRELFSQDMAAEQRRLNDLLAASQDAKVLEERRRFFSSPMGAAAIAKAEARRVVSNLPPPAAGGKLQPPVRHRPAPAVRAPAAPAPAAPAPAAPAPRPESRPALRNDTVDDEPTTFRPREDDDEPTEYRDPRQDDDFEEEMTTFRPERQDDSDRPTHPPHNAHDAADTDAPRAADPVEERTPAVPVSYAQRRASATGAFEEEATSYFDPGRRESLAWGAARSAEPVTVSEDLSERAASARPSLPSPGYEEEATHIFFSTEDEELPPLGIPRPSGAVPPIVAGRVDPGTGEALRRSTPSEVRSRNKTGAGLNSGAPANQSGRLWPLADNPLPAAAGQQLTWQIPAARVERGPTLEVEAAAPRLEKRTLLWISGVMVALTIIGVIVKTPLGITLGVRSPSEGAIEVRTVPPIAAAVRLDGIYRGRAPLRLEGVRVGERMLALEAEGYVTVARRVTVEGGNTASLNISLEPQKAPTP